MNKISKKIVSLVTMAAFALTLVPAAAFAAAVEDTTYTVSPATASDLNKTTVEITLSDDDYAALKADTAKNVLVWAENAQGAVVDYSTLNAQATNATATEWTGEEAGILSNPTDQKISVDLTFAKGAYDIYVAVNDGDPGYFQHRSDAKANAIVADGEAFQAYNAADRSKSVYGVFDGKELQEAASVDINKNLTTSFEINDSQTAYTVGILEHVVIWAVDSKTNNPTSCLVVNGANKVDDNYAYEIGSVQNPKTVDIQFTADGEYTLYAGIGTTYAQAKENKLIGSTKVTVNDTTAVDSMDITAGWKADSSATTTAITDKDVFKFDKDAKTYTLDLTKVNGFKFNGISRVVLDGKAFNEDGSPALRQTINFAASEPNTVVKLSDTSDYTGSTGTFHVEFTMESQKNTVITVTDAATGVSYDVNVIAQNTSATDIDATKNGGYVLATTDDNWTPDVNAKLSDAVQFMVTDEKGDAVEGLGNDAFVLNVESYPKKDSTIKNTDLEVVPVGDGLYTLKVNATKGSKILTEGQYKVRVALAGVDSENDNIGVTFTAAEFDKIEDVELNITDKKTGVELDDQITLDTEATVSLVYVDGNGVKIAGPTTFSWNATNSALAVQSATGTTLVMKPDTIEHQGVIGSTVTVQAAVPSYGLVTKELTIVSSYNTYSLELDPAEGPVNEYNKVDLNVLNSDGDVAKNINGDINVVVADSSNEDAKVSVKAAKDVKNGEGALTIYASQETELELVVTVEKAGKILAADTLTYTVGAADPLAGRTVVMTIDSTEYVVNNNIITGDAAPYVDSNWRTMVPIRALAEAFDAEVYWNQDDSTVTINFDAGTEIVMTVGEETYTVNGAEATMDTEPVNAGDRVYVPIRFAAEGLGFSVTPLYNDAGLTASVVFQR